MSISMSISILSIISSTASISGLILQFFGKSQKTKLLLSILFLSATIFSGYILFVPGNQIIENVTSKTKYYTKEMANDVLIQEENFSFNGRGPITIQFPIPYSQKPEKVYILNPNNYDMIEVPSIIKTTNHFIEVRRNGSAGLELTPTFLQEYKWVAEGKPFKVDN